MVKYNNSLAKIVDRLTIINWEDISKLSKYKGKPFVEYRRYPSDEGYLTEEFMRLYINNLNINNLCTYQKLSKQFIKDHRNILNWENISKYQTLSEDFIREFKNDVDWENISKEQTLSEDFIREFKNDVDWENISEHQILSEDFIREFKNDVDWDKMHRQDMSLDFIRKFRNRLDIGTIVMCTKIPEDILKTYLENLTEKPGCDYMCSIQQFTEPLILKFHDKLYMDKICRYQIMSNKFILKNKKIFITHRGICLCYLLENPNITLDDKLKQLIDKLTKSKISRL